MTEKLFIKWLRRFIAKTDIKNVHFQKRYDPTYNHTTMLREIADKLEEVCKKEQKIIVKDYLYQNYIGVFNQKEVDLEDPQFV